MKLVVDTHAPLWALGNPDRLSGSTRDMMRNPAHDVLVSIVSLWEIAVKSRIGKLKADPARVAGTARAAGLQNLGITVAHLTALKSLPSHHRDPFDHLLIAQSIVEDAALVTEDRHFGRYDSSIIPAR